jgi:putative tryptophan/tyrosine transport system substrate-binding protein
MMGALMRGALVAGAVLGTVMAVSAAGGQPPAKVTRVGVLTLSVASSAPTFEAFRQGLSEHGYVEGQNIAVEFRFAQGRPERLPAMAAELAKMKVAVIVTESVLAAREVKHATETIPIVTAIHGDPVGAGLATSLTRPGGNVTGLSLAAPELSGKRLELLKEVTPKTTQVAAIWNAANPAAARYLTETRAAARLLGLELQSVEVRSPPDLDVAFKAVAGTRPSALITLPDGMLLAHKTRIIEFAAKTRLAALFPDQEFAEAGGLMAYGPSLASNFRRAAAYVDKILKGAKPADLPIEQPTQFELAINLKTAKALGLTIPQSVIQRADKVIQ